ICHHLDGGLILYGSLVYLPRGSETKVGYRVRHIASAICGDGGQAVVDYYNSFYVLNRTCRPNHALFGAGIAYYGMDARKISVCVRVNRLSFYLSADHGGSKK